MFARLEMEFVHKIAYMNEVVLAFFAILLLCASPLTAYADDSGMRNDSPALLASLEQPRELLSEDGFDSLANEAAELSSRMELANSSSTGSSNTDATILKAAGDGKDARYGSSGFGYESGSEPGNEQGNDLRNELGNASANEPRSASSGSTAKGSELECAPINATKAASVRKPRPHEGSTRTMTAYA